MKANCYIFKNCVSHLLIYGYFEIGHRECIYTTDMGKCHKLGLCFVLFFPAELVCKHTIATLMVKEEGNKNQGKQGSLKT